MESLDRGSSIFNSGGGFMDIEKICMEHHKMRSAFVKIELWIEKQVSAGIDADEMLDLQKIIHEAIHK